MVGYGVASKFRGRRILSKNLAIEFGNAVTFFAEARDSTLFHNGPFISTEVSLYPTKGASVFKFAMVVTGASTAHRQFGLQLMLPEAYGGLGD